MMIQFEIDLENLYRQYRSRTVAEATDATLGHVDWLLGHRLVGAGLHHAIAYADISMLPDRLLRQLTIRGIFLQHARGTRHKSRTDCAMTVAGMMNAARPDIDTFVLVSGDGDFVPLVAHWLAMGKKVYVAALPGTLSSDLGRQVGAANVLIIPTFGSNMVPIGPVVPAPTPNSLPRLPARRSA